MRHCIRRFPPPPHPKTDCLAKLEIGLPRSLSSLTLAEIRVPFQPPPDSGSHVVEFGLVLVLVVLVLE